MILARKNYQNTRIFFMTFARKMYKIPEFYMIHHQHRCEFAGTSLRSLCDMTKEAQSSFTDDV